MTMHLMGPQFTTTSTRKRKQNKKSASLLEAERQHAKFLKKMGIGTRSSAGSEQRPSKPWVTGSSPVECAKLQTRSSVWLERTAHNGYVVGSSPAGSTTLRGKSVSGRTSDSKPERRGSIPCSPANDRRNDAH